MVPFVSPSKTSASQGWESNLPIKELLSASSQWSFLLLMPLRALQGKGSHCPHGCKDMMHLTALMAGKLLACCVCTWLIQSWSHVKTVLKEVTVILGWSCRFPSRHTEVSHLSKYCSQGSAEWCGVMMLTTGMPFLEKFFLLLNTILGIKSKGAVLLVVQKGGGVPFLWQGSSYCQVWD